VDAAGHDDDEREARPNSTPPQPQPSLRELVAEERRRAAEELSLIRREEARCNARPSMKAASGGERKHQSGANAEVDDEAAAAAKVLEARRRAMADLEKVRRQDRQTERSSAVKLPWGHPAAASSSASRRGGAMDAKSSPRRHADPSVTPVAKSLFERADTDEDGFLRRREAYAAVREHLEASPPPPSASSRQPVGIAKIQNAYDKVAKETREELGERAAEAPPGAIDVSGLQKLLDAVASQSGGGPRRRPPAESAAATKKPPSVSPPPRPPQQETAAAEEPTAPSQQQQPPLGTETRDALKALSMSIARANSIQTLPAPPPHPSHPRHSPSPARDRGSGSRSPPQLPHQHYIQQQTAANELASSQASGAVASAKALSPPRPVSSSVPDRRCDPILSRSTAAALAAMRSARSRNTSAAGSPGPCASAIGADSAGPSAARQLPRNGAYSQNVYQPQPLLAYSNSAAKPAASPPRRSSGRPLSPPSVVPLEGRRMFATMSSPENLLVSRHHRDTFAAAGASSAPRTSVSPTRGHSCYQHVVGAASSAAGDAVARLASRHQPGPPVAREPRDVIEAAAAPQPKFVLAPERARVLLQTLLKLDGGFVGKLVVPVVAQALCELGLFPSPTVASQFMRARRLLSPDTAQLDTALVDYVAVVSELKRAR
jgi:hypothetical protein